MRTINTAPVPSAIAIIALISAINLTAIRGFAYEEQDKLSIPLKAVPLKDREGLQKIINEKTALLSWRDEEIETSLLVFNYLLDRPVLTSKIFTELGIATYQISPLPEDEKYLQFDDGEGLTGEFKTVYKKGEKRIYHGTYLYKTGTGVPVKLSGELILILKYGNKKDGLKINIDLYLKSSDDGLNKITRGLPFILKSIMVDKIDSYIESFRELSRWIYEDPADVLDRLKDSDEIEAKDLKEFSKIFKIPYNP